MSYQKFGWVQPISDQWQPYATLTLDLLVWYTFFTFLIVRSLVPGSPSIAWPAISKGMKPKRRKKTITSHPPQNCPHAPPNAEK